MAKWINRPKYSDYPPITEYCSKTSLPDNESALRMDWVERLLFFFIAKNSFPGETCFVLRK